MHEEEVGLMVGAFRTIPHNVLSFELDKMDFYEV